MSRYEQTVGQVAKHLNVHIECDVSAYKSAEVIATSVPDAIEDGEQTNVQGLTGAQEQTTAVLVPAVNPGLDTSAQSNYYGLYLVERMCTNLCNQGMMEMHGAGITKPSRGDKLITARTLAYLRGDINGVQSNDTNIGQRRATRCHERCRLAPRRAAIRRERAFCDRPANPPSGDELAN